MKGMNNLIFCRKAIFDSVPLPTKLIYVRLKPIQPSLKHVHNYSVAAVDCIETHLYEVVLEKNLAL